MNGNMIADHNKGITLIEYNEFNLPTKIHFSTDDASGKYIEYAYDATGTKQLKRVKNENQTGYHLTYYAGAFIYEKQITESTPSLKFIQQPDGYFEPTGTSPSGELEGAYTYQYKDHTSTMLSAGLGNIRLSYSDLDGNGVINPNTEIKEAKDYYAFGLEHSMPNKQIIGTRYPYGFNGKEENNNFGLEWLDFGARNYDAALGRWMNIDPLAELMPDQSPYNYAFNNPIFWIDPDGRMPEGAQTSYGTDLSSAAGSFFGTTITGSNTSTDENGRKVTTDTKTYANTDAGREGLVNEMNEIRGSEGSEGNNDTLRSVLLNSGISNPDEAAPINMESIDIVTKALSDLHGQAKNPEFQIVNEIDGDSKRSGRTTSTRYIYGSGRTEIVVHPVKIAHLAFRSWMQLASTVGHELIHVIDFHGNYYNWAQRYGEEGAIARSEINAHRWQIQMSAPVNMTRYERYLDKVYTFHHLKPSGIQQALKISSK